MKKRHYIIGGATLAVASLHAQIVINEIDADTAGDDALEFIELYDGGAGNTSLDGYVVVFYNGSDDQSYLPVFDLDGQTTDANGFFVIGNPGVANVDLTFEPGSFGALQNGADAVALYSGFNDTDFPNDTALTTVNLIDAVVYDTNDGDDATLLTLLLPGQAQLNEDELGDKDNQSLARLPDGGTARDTSTYFNVTPTPGASNGTPSSITVSLDSNTIAESSFGVITATFTRTGTSGDLEISLSLDDNSEALLDSNTVTILDTTTSITVDIFALDDTYPDGDKTVTLTATPSGGASEIATFDVTDDVTDEYTLVINEVYTIPQEDLNGVGGVSNDDEFLEIVNISGAAVDLSDFTIEDTITGGGFPGGTVHTFRPGTILEDDCAIIVGSGGFAEGASAGVFGTAEVQNSSEGTTLAISNTGDIMKLFNADGDEVYAVEVPDLTDSPELGSYVLASDGDPSSGYVRQANINLAFSSPGVDNLGANFCTTTAVVTAVASAPTVVENAGVAALSVTVTIPSSLGDALEVFVYSSDTTEVGVPFGDPLATGTIATGFTSTVVDLDVIDDNEIDGTQTVTLVAGASGYLNGTTTVDVTDDGNDSPGLGTCDIAFVASISDNPDLFAFVALSDIAGGVEINFTDNGWFAAGGFRSGEGTVTWTSPGGGITAGTVVTFTGNIPDVGTGSDPGNGPALSSSGDQVIAYQGSAASPTIIAAIQMNGAWDADATSSNTSALPPALTTEGAVAIDPEVDNAVYTGSTTGTVAELKALLFDAANFTTSNTRGDVESSVPLAFVIGAGGVDLVATSITTSGTTATIEFTSSGNVDVYKTTDLQDFTSLGSPYASDVTSPYTDATATESAAYYILVPTGDPAP